MTSAVRRAAALALALAASLAAACSGGPTSPGSRELTGYLLTFTPSSFCSFLYPQPFPIVLGRQQEADGWQWFSSARTVGGPRDPALRVGLRNSGSSSIEGLLNGGTQTAELPPRLLMFSVQREPFLFPGPQLPFEGVGQLGSPITGSLAAAILGSSISSGSSCFAFDHKVQLVPVFERLDF